jgi:predicted unusual protein kinase regulating ubiquinone biosynthesis (AarF/ABC1/UbiB family)
MIRHNLTLPPNLVLMIKALSMIESTGKELYPDLDMLEVAGHL